MDEHISSSRQVAWLGCWHAYRIERLLYGHSTVNCGLATSPYSHTGTHPYTSCNNNNNDIIKSVNMKSENNNFYFSFRQCNAEKPPVRRQAPSAH